MIPVHLDRPRLASLAREWLLAGHLVDRAGMPQVIARHGREVMEAIAIEEWMAASPVYTRRMQRAFGFEGDDVTTIFKGMQLDIGAPPGFMDFRYTVHDERHGEFQLAHCGALLDVEPMGDDFVVGMCHHIEDPTFDATAAATNPRARVRPLHRPPRTPADRHPHCHWTVTIDPDADPLEEPVVAVALGRSRLAQTELSSIDPAAEGESAYDGPLQPDLDLAGFSRSALVHILEEVALQGQLLAHGFMTALAARFGDEEARDLGTKQLTGSAGVTSQRLGRWLGATGDGLDAVAAVLAVHPAFQPAPVIALHADREPDVLTLSLDVESDGEDLTWPALLRAGADRAVEAAVQSVDRRARVERLGDAPAWRVRRVDEPAEELQEVLLASFSGGATFVLP